MSRPRWGSLALALLLGARAFAGEDATVPPKYDGRTAAQWTADLSADDVVLRRKAAYALWNLGRDAGEAATRLVASLRDPDDYVRTTAAKAIGRLDVTATKPLVPGIAALLFVEREDVRRESATLLGRLGPLAADAVPELTRALASGDEVVRANAAAALGNAGAAGKPAVEGLVRAVADESEEVRTRAATSLARIDPAVAFASQRWEVRTSALTVYADDVASKPWERPDVLAGVIKCIDDPIEDVRAWAVHALDTYAASMGTLRPVAWIGIFRRVLEKEPLPRTRGAAALGLGRYEGHGEEVVPALVQATRSPEPEVTQGAVLAIALLGAEARAAVPAVVRCLGADDVGTRRSAAYCLAKIAPASDPQVTGKLLGAATRDPEPSVRRNAMSSLVILDKGSRETAKELVAVMRNAKNDATTRAAAARAVFDIGVPEIAVPVLRWEFDHDRDVPPVIAFALCALDCEDSDRALERLIAKIGDGDPRYDVLPLIGQLGPKAEPAVPRVAEVLKSNNRWLRLSAARTLLQLGGVATAALPTLEAAAEDPDGEVASIARKAIDAIRAATAPPK